MSHDATVVILAGGRNTRLAGLVPDYHKPFLVVGGRSLLGNQVDLAGQLGLPCVVVCAPENAQPTASLLRPRWSKQLELHLLVQPEPRGPTEGLHRALPLVHTSHVIVLCADNTLKLEDLQSCVEHMVYNPLSLVVCGRWLSAVRGERFVRVGPDRRVYEGPRGPAEQVWDGQLMWCWIGPLVIPIGPLRERLGPVPAPPSTSELKLGLLLAELQLAKEFVTVSSWDYGLPGEL
jgi:GTP:adenosylcobinamide-phosphate guanylyltransferase